MKLKTILGLVIPASIIIVLVALSISGIGEHMETKPVDRVLMNQLNMSSSVSMPVLEITMTNDFFLPRRFELPGLVACLADKDSTMKTNMQSRYTDSSMVGVPDSDLVYGYSSNAPRQSTEVAPYSKKTVKLVVSGYYMYDGNFANYDEILLVPSDNNYYDACSNLDSDKLDKAIHIPLY